MRKLRWLSAGLGLCLAANSARAEFNLFSFFARPNTTATNQQPLPVPTQNRPTSFKLADLVPATPGVFGKTVIPTTTLPANTQFADPSFLRAWHANRPGRPPF